ncbi:unnamed protein product [Oppiella nova]|uniref:Fucosyltransferase n=1 Tax=Oppiella nova TaxID=334625 RepID=A0A7R9M906_9ACAR|nr:unnamed protein product [Oppiella nova]CAG2173027.1 unnamed protein product [Oppiella nova]
MTDIPKTKPLNQKWILFNMESPLCKDYVSEKLFNAMKYDIIPIVFGSANYTAILPPNSYINALQFPTMTTLADHLIEVAIDKDRYDSYFHWKNDYCVQDVDYLCELCEHLNLNAVKTRVSTRKRDIVSWWINDAHCQTIQLV